MRKSRFTDEQMVAILRKADRETVAVFAKQRGISEQTIYTWRKRFGTMQADDVRRLRQLEVENVRLKKLVDGRIRALGPHEGPNGAIRDRPRPDVIQGAHRLRPRLS